MRAPKTSPLPPPMQFTGRTTVRTRGHEWIFFGGCDYFRMSSHPTVLRAASRALKEMPLSVCASRRTTGNHATLEMLETELAEFFHSPSALVVSNGYATNLIVAQALAGQFDEVLLDERAHGSLVDAAVFLGCRVRRFAHRDVPAVKRLLKSTKPDQRVILLTDGLCAHDGQEAPLREYRAILSAQSWMLIDDAHGAGVVGPKGRGSLEFAGIVRSRVIQTTTLSKAFGSHGGVILCDRPTRADIIEHSRMFIGSTPPALPLIAAARAALRWVADHPSLRQRAQHHAESIRAVLRENGYPIDSVAAPIVAIIAGTPARAARLESSLRARGILPPRLRYPGSPAGGYFRFVISSEHRPRDIDLLSLALKNWLGGKIS